MAPLDSIDWTNARLVIPPARVQGQPMRLGSDLLDDLRAQGKGWQALINKVLRAWYEVASKREKAANAKRLRPRLSRRASDTAADIIGQRPPQPARRP